MAFGITCELPEFSAFISGRLLMFHPLSNQI